MTADPKAVHVASATFEEVLARDGVLVYRTRGVSMEPMLREGRDVVTIRAAKPGERVSVNDVVMYYRAGDRKYTLHRIVRVGPAGYTIIGDNCVAYERDVPFEDVLGVLVSFAYVRKLRRGERGRIARRKATAKVKGALRRTFPGLAKRWKDWKHRGETA